MGEFTTELPGVKQKSAPQTKVIINQRLTTVFSWLILEVIREGLEICASPRFCINDCARMVQTSPHENKTEINVVLFHLLHAT